MWSKIDDKLHSSQQQRTAGLEAMGLWTLGESYCGDQLTDGFIPAWFVAEKCGQRKGVALADRLVRAQLWERAVFGAEKGWLSVGYVPRNKPAEQVLADREAERLRKAEQRRKAKEEREAEELSRQLSQRDTGLRPGVRTPRPDQTRPDQTRRTLTPLPLFQAVVT
jgi:hypothetical protein